MPVCLPEALAHYHKVAEQERKKAEAGFQPIFHYPSTPADESSTMLRGVVDLLGGTFNRAAFKVTRSRFQKAMTAISEDRLHDLVDPMVRLNLIRAISFDADSRGLDINDLPCIQSGDFKRILAYAAARAQHIGVANAQASQRLQPK